MAILQEFSKLQSLDILKVSRCIYKPLQMGHNVIYKFTVVPTKSDSDVILCLQLLSKIINSTLHLS